MGEEYLCSPPATFRPVRRSPAAIASGDGSRAGYAVLQFAVDEVDIDKI